VLRFDTAWRSLDTATDPSVIFTKKMLRDAKNFIVRIPHQYNQAITSSPAREYAGWNCVHTPFPHLCVELEGGFVFEGHRYELFVFYGGENVDQTRLEYPWLLIGTAMGPRLDDPRYLSSIPAISAFFSDKEVNYDVALDSDGKWRLIDGVARNILDFLSTPSIHIEREPGMDKINRSRRKSRKPPLTDYHIITWSTHSLPMAQSGQGSKHRIRYDVRGHFATFTRGPLSGRRIWRPAHQRGLANDFFRPKGYQR